MSKYEPLWKWIAENGQEKFKLTYAQVEEILGFPIDHSFLKYKKEFLSNFLGSDQSDYAGV